MKTIKILIIVIVILIIILGIKISGVSLFKQKDEITLEELKEIASKAKNIENYSCEYTMGFNCKEKFNKNKEISIKQTEEREYITWIDYENDEQIVISEEESIAIISTISEYNSNSYKELENTLNNSQIEEYEYLGKENYNGYECIHVKFRNNVDSEEESEVEMWIDENSGFIMKYILIYYNQEPITIEYNIDFNCVTDQDVERPDLSKYKKVVNNEE